MPGALKEPREDCIPEPRLILAVTVTALKVSRALKRDNPRFNEDKFLAACGIPEEDINQ